jgi:hypothetical protein
MGYIQGEGRDQGTLLPVVLDDFVPADHVCRVIDTFVEKLMMSKLASNALRTGRPGYDPRDLLKRFPSGLAANDSWTSASGDTPPMASICLFRIAAKLDLSAAVGGP